MALRLGKMRYKDQRMVYVVLTCCVGCELYAVQDMSTFNIKFNFIPDAQH